MPDPHRHHDSERRVTARKVLDRIAELRAQGVVGGPGREAYLAVHEALARRVLGLAAPRDADARRSFDAPDERFAAGDRLFAEGWHRESGEDG